MGNKKLTLANQIAETHTVAGLYGAVVAAGGIVGYAKAGSVVSLAAGGVSGVFLLGIAYLAWQDYKQTPVTSKTYPAAALGVSLLLTGVMATRYVQSSKFMPAGMVACLSVAASVFFATKIFAQKRKAKKSN